MMVRSTEPILIKRYANQRLYLPTAGSYLSRQDIRAMAGHGENFIIIDAITGEDITNSLRPILIER